MSAGWLSVGYVTAGGTLYAGGTPPLRIRAPDGTWTDEDAPIARPRFIDGSGEDDVWLLADGAAYERAPDGTWTDRGLPSIASASLDGLEVGAPDDVTVVASVSYTCGDCPTATTPYVLQWDGTAWTETEYPETNGSITGATVLPDGTVVVAVGGRLSTLGTPGVEVPVPPDTFARVVRTAADGTLVALADEAVLTGTLSGMTAVGTGFSPGAEFSSVWATSPTDVWVAWVDAWELGLVPYATISHWDGVAWTDLVTHDDAGALWWLGPLGDQIVALGGYDHEVVWVGGVDGFSVERERWGPPDGFYAVSIDDVTGIPWGVGSSPILGVFENGAWRGEPLPDRTVLADRIAASAGRVGLAASDALYTYEGGAVTKSDRPGAVYFTAAHGGGTLFALGRDAAGDLVVEQDAGAGWVALPLVGLPPGLDPRGAWADGPTDLWMGFEDDAAGGGGIAYWDGVAWTVAATLRTDPEWMARLDDGLLYFTQFEDPGVGEETLWTWDGVVAAPVPDLVPDVRAAYLFPDGTRVLSAIFDDPIEGLSGRIAVQEPGGAWVDLITGGGVFDLVGDGVTAWAGGEWTLGACVP